MGGNIPTIIEIGDEEIDHDLVLSHNESDNAVIINSDESSNSINSCDQLISPTPH